MHDIAVIGAGLVGLATAHRLRERGASVVVLEKEPAPARHQSGHNSGVVHAGLYYEPGSLKARLCREGAQALREKCAEWEIPVIDRGKLVVASFESELPALAELERRGRANGIAGIDVLDDWHDVEPHVRGVRALHVPETGVVDYVRVAAKLAEGLDVRYGVAFRGEAPAGFVVACAGLQADRVAVAAGFEPGVRIVPFRGDYWRIGGRSADLVRGLVYPVPDPAFPFLGVHFTRDVAGGVTAGPNAVPALARETYSRTGFSLRDATASLTWPGFYRVSRRYARTGALEIWRDAVKPAAIAQMRGYLPAIDARDVVRGGCGIRAQAIRRDGVLVDDFLLEEGPSSLHVLNAPSPAATSCLAIGSLVADRVLH